LQPGKVYGESDRFGAWPKNNPVHPYDLITTIYHALDIDPATEYRDSLQSPPPPRRARPASPWACSEVVKCATSLAELATLARRASKGGLSNHIPRSRSGLCAWYTAMKNGTTLPNRHSRSILEAEGSCNR